MSTLTRALAFPALLVAALLPSGSSAQSTCRPGSESAEAQLLAWYAVPLAFSSALPAPTLGTGEIAVAIEGTYVPAPSRDVRRSDECFVAKSQNTELSPVLPRPRVAIGLPGGLTAEVSYLPPVTVADATPNLLGLALAYGLPTVRDIALQVRLHGTVGHVEGPITCSEQSLQPNPAQPCFGTEPSQDRFAPNVYGTELLAGVALGNAWHARAAAGVSHARSRFQVGFRNGFDILDDTRVARDFTRATGALGITRVISPRLDVGLLAYGVAGDAATVRLTGQWRIR